MPCEACFRACKKTFPQSARLTYKDDRGEGDAHAHSLFGGVAAGVLAFADKDRQVMERQDVVDVDGREDDERHGEWAHAGAGGKADKCRHAHAEHGHDRAHEHVDDHGKRGDEQGEQEDVLRHGAGEHDVGDPGVHAGGTAHGAHGHGGRQEHEGLDVDSVPAGGSEDFADDGHGESNANGQGDPWVAM